MSKKSILAVLTAAALISTFTGCDKTGGSDPVADGASSTDITESNVSGEEGAGGAPAVPSDPRDADSDVPYTWGNVAIGCGGYTPEIYYNPGEEGLVYARTDIGGAYRLDKETDEWIPLTDEFGTSEYSFYGIDGLATDPVETNRVYLLAGMYTTGWLEIGNAYILRSEDYGNTWDRVPMEFSSGGNEPNRFCDRLEIDPNNNATLYTGGRDGSLWKSTDYGATWEKLPLPEVELYQEDGYTFGVTFISFDETGKLYVGVAGKGKDARIFVSSDGGQSFEPLAGQPNARVPYHGVPDGNGHIYFVYSGKAGPYTVNDGTIRKYTIADGTWEDVTPTELASGAGDIEVDPANPDILTVSSIGKWGAYENDCLYRSLDGGKTWSSIFTGDGENRKFTVDYSDSPWLDWGKAPAKLGWMMGDIAINPFDGNEMMYGTGATIFRTKNLSDWDSGKTVEFKTVCHGFEETAIMDLVSPPTGEVQLYSAMGDIDGFSHKDVDVIPDNMNNNGSFTSSHSIDCAWLSPNIVARCGSGNHVVEISEDYGKTWKQCKPKGCKNETGTVAVNADGTAIYWTGESDPSIYVTEDLGETWTVLEKMLVKGRIECDRNDPDALYAFSSGSMFISRDRGKTFTMLNQMTPMTGHVVSDPSAAGVSYIVSTAGGMYRVGSYGENDEDFSRNPAFSSVNQLAFGKAKEEGGPLAMYVIGTLKDTEFIGVYRSIDGGETWQRINDGKHEFGSIGGSLAADMNVFGQVYFGTNGRGIIMGRSAE